jgi:hypothetical protein
VGAQAQFKLESANYVETLTWVSGFSYALTETAKISKSGAYCLPPQGSIGSKELIEILNAGFPGQTIKCRVRIGRVTDRRKTPPSVQVVPYNGTPHRDAGA